MLPRVKPTCGRGTALLAPTAFGKQAFTLTGGGNEMALTCPEGDCAGQDRDIVTYFFEVGAGYDSFRWAF